MKNNFQSLLNLLLITGCLVGKHYFVEGTALSNPTVDSTNSTNSNDAANANGQQSVISTCHAVRAVTGHSGEIAKWKSKCRVEVWTDKEQPDLSFLNADDRNRVMTDMAQPNSVNSGNNDIYERSRYLADEAATRHYLCMEARKTILDKLKMLLPAGMIDCNRITEVMNNLKLTPELEAFIGQVNGPMKDLVARIHAIEQNSSTPEPEKREALRAAKTDLTRLLDETCKDDHPSIRYNNVGYMPSPAMENVRMVLVMPQPGRNIQFFSAPESHLGLHADYLRGMTEAAAHHARTTGQGGDMEAIYHNWTPDSLGSSSVQRPSDVPGVISLVSQAKPSNGESSPLSSGSSAGTVNNSGNNSPAVAETSSESVSTDSTSADDLLKPVIDNFWKSVDDAKTADPKNFIQSDAFNEALSALFTEENLAKVGKVEYKSTEKMWGRKYDALNEEEKRVEDSYQRSKTLLKQARDVKKKALGFTLTGAIGQNYVDYVYKTGKESINQTREQGKSALPLQGALTTFVNNLKGKDQKFDEPATRSALEALLSEESMAQITEKPDYPRSTVNYWKRPYSGLNEEEKAVELKYQKKKELITLAQKSLSKAGMNKRLGIYLTPFSKMVYNLGKKMIDEERDAGKQSLSKTTASTGSVGGSSFFSFLGGKK